jgi:hypothetical protein
MIVVVMAVVFASLPVRSAPAADSAGNGSLKVFSMREEAQTLKDDAEKLEEMTDDLDDDADRLEEQAEDLADRIEERPNDSLEQRARALERSAEALREKIEVMQALEREKRQKARKVERSADSLQEALDTRPVQVRRPFQISLQAQYTEIGPYSDNDPHLLLFAGAGFSYFVSPMLEVGVQNLGIDARSTVFGNRVAIAGSPAVTISIFPVDKLQLAVSVGARMQGQFGSHQESTLSVGPFAMLAPSLWIKKRVSIGPLLQWNYLAHGEMYTQALPFDKANVLPQGAAWMDGGLMIGFHF